MSEDETMAEQEEQPKPKTAMSKFDGMDIEVKLPTPDQLGVYRVLQKSFRRASTKGSDMPADEASRLLGNLFEMVASILVDPDDIDYIKGEVLAGRCSLTDLIPLVTDGIEALKLSNETPDEKPKTRVVTSS